MNCVVSSPFLSQIVMSEDGKETAMVRAIIMINRIHYVILIPLVTQFPLSEFIDTDDLYEYEIEEAVSFARIKYDYQNTRAIVEPLCPYQDADIVNVIVDYLELMML